MSDHWKPSLHPRSRGPRLNRAGAALMAAGLISAAAMVAPARAQAVDVTTLINEGTDMVPACVSCHGEQGLGDADFGAPMIAGMDAGYIKRMLTAYADGTRVGDTMNGIAPELSSDEIVALAAHFAALPASRKPWQMDIAAAERGQAIVQNGIMGAGVPACVSCHGQNGEGIGATFPRLAGQLPDYMVARIDLWRSGEDPAGTPEEAIMARIATAAPPDAMKAAIAHFAGLDPAAGPSTGYTPFTTDWPVLTYNTKPLPDEITWSKAEAAYAAQEKRLADPALYEHVPPGLAEIPDTPLGDMIRLGREIFTNTQVLRGTFVGNDLTCSNCHMNAGANPLAAPIWATAVDFPIYRSKNQHVNTLAERLAGCFKYSMNGTPPPAQHEVMVALESYMRWLATGAPSGAVQKARGYVILPMPAQTPDYARGEAVYAGRCAMCHGTDGAGQKEGARVVFPPVWGPNSYNWGAGMLQIEKAAGFLKANMPLGNPDLSDQAAWDVALYIDGHERPQDPRWLGNVEATRRAYHDEASTYGLRMADGLMGDTGAPLPKPEAQPWATWSSTWKPAE
jgi:thiosulfate dehydrogenase